MRNVKISSANFVIAAAMTLAATLASGVAGAQAYPGQRYPDTRDRTVNSQQELFEWTGRVDREIRIEANRNNASIVKLASNERNNGGRIRNFSGVPRRNGTVTVQVLEGRGRVDVIEQPNARNGYTAVIRLRDPDSGASRYRIAAYFTPNGYDDGRYGRRR
jgi:hypothetical protein